MLLPRRFIFCVAVALWCAVAAGCQSGSAGRSSTTAPLATASVIEERIQPDGTKTKTTRTGSATGTGAMAAGDKVNQSLNAQPAAITIDGVTATGGGGVSKSNATGAALGQAMRSPLLWVGIACLLAAGAAFYFNLKGIVVPALAAGVGFIAIALYPQIILWALLGIAVIIGVPYFMTAWKAKHSTEALRAVVAGVADAPPETQIIVTDHIRAHADEADKATIKAIKKADNVVMAEDVPALVNR